MGWVIRHGALGLLLLGACVSDSTTAGDAGAKEGKLDGPCHDNGTCDDALVCVPGIKRCAPAGTDGSMPADSMSGMDSTMMMDAGGGDCGKLSTTMSIPCGANACYYASASCCQMSQACFALEGGTCSGQSWSCSEKAHCGAGACCLQYTGTAGLCPLTLQTIASSKASCMPSVSMCGTAGGLVMCVDNTSCTGVTGTTCKTVAIPGNKLVGLCMP